MKFQAVAWDIDGTLIDSEPLHHEALVAACQHLGSDISDLPDKAFQGIHLYDVWSLLADRLPRHVTRNTWIDVINSYYVEQRNTLVPITDALEIIAAIAEKGLQQVCVSNSNRSIVDANIDALGISPWISFSISLDDVKAGKPDPEPYLQACQRLGIAPQHVLAIEDSKAGQTSARNAGLSVIEFDPLRKGNSIPDLGICELGHIREILGL